MSNMAMPLTSAATVTEENITTPNKELSMSRQSTSHLLLIEPEVFYANPEYCYSVLLNILDTTQ